MLQNVYNGAQDAEVFLCPPGTARRLVNTGFAGVRTNVLPVKSVLRGLNLDWFDEEKIFALEREKVAGAETGSGWEEVRKLEFQRE